MPFQRLSGRLNYYITRWGQEVSELGTREVGEMMWSGKPPLSRRGPRDPQCVGDQTSWRQNVVEKATTQQKGPSGPPMEFGDQTSWWYDAIEKASRVGPRASNWASGERESHNADGHKSGGQYIAVLFGLQLPLTRKPYNKVRGIFFKEVFASLLLLCQYVFSIYMYICIVV